MNLFEIEDSVSKLLNEIPCKGDHVKINGLITVTHPRMLLLGSNVHIGGGAYLNTRGGLSIGDNTHISRNLIVYTSNHRYESDLLPYNSEFDCKPVSIGRNVWIGINVCITPGVKIGEGAIIGMGSVITRDVPPFAIVGNQAFRNLGERDISRYKSLVDSDSFSGPDGLPLAFDITSRSPFQLGEKLFFILGTGRSGSATLASILSQHPEATCLHEPRGPLINLSTEYEHGIKSIEQVRDDLIDLYQLKTVKTQFYGESDQKLSNLVPVLSELFPKAKFVWVIRDPKEAVQSTYSRGWFDDREFNYPLRKDLNVDSVYSPKIYSDNRINGFRAGEFSESEWMEMTPFERNCWYWTFWNKKIMDDLSKLPEDRQFKVKLSELGNQLKSLSEFLGFPEYDLSLSHDNKAVYDKKTTLNDDELKGFERYIDHSLFK